MKRSETPDPKGEGRRMWCGYEVEGRLLGVTTLFVADPTLTFNDIMVSVPRYKFGHVYFLKSYWPDNHKMIAENFEDIPLTFEVPVGARHPTALSSLLVNRGRFWRFQFVFEVSGEVYRLMECASHLDEIRLDIADVCFKNTVVPFAVTTRTLPGDYKDDQEVKL